MHPGCFICFNSFGILDHQLLFECPTKKCDAQYCKQCVMPTIKPNHKMKFACMTCKEDVDLVTNSAFEKYLIWPN